MNKKNIIALVLGSSLVSGGAFAASDNTITFQGKSRMKPVQLP